MAQPNEEEKKSGKDTPIENFKTDELEIVTPAVGIIAIKVMQLISMNKSER